MLGLACQAFLKEMTGAPERNRTPNLQIRSLTLYPIELRAHTHGGERGIRTLAPGFPDSCLAGKRYRPLSHLSVIFQYYTKKDKVSVFLCKFSCCFSVFYQKYSKSGMSAVKEIRCKKRGL